MLLSGLQLRNLLLKEWEKEIEQRYVVLTTYINIHSHDLYS